jgi:hypothetical protein
MRDIPVRAPGASTPDAVRNAAASAGRRRRAPGMRVLERVRDALVRLPYSALGPYYYRIPATAWRRRAHRPSSPIAVILPASRPPAWGGCPTITIDGEAVTPSPGEDDSEPDECEPLRTARPELKLCQALAALDPSPDLHARIAAQLRKLPRYNATDPDTRQAADFTVCSRRLSRT